MWDHCNKLREQHFIQQAILLATFTYYCRERLLNHKQRLCNHIKVKIYLLKSPWFPIYVQRNLWHADNNKHTTDLQDVPKIKYATQMSLLNITIIPNWCKTVSFDTNLLSEFYAPLKRAVILQHVQDSESPHPVQEWTNCVLSRCTDCSTLTTHS